MAGETGTTAGGASDGTEGGTGSSSSGTTTTTESKGAQTGAGGAGTTPAGDPGAGGQQKEGSKQDPKGAGTEAPGKGGEPKGQEPTTTELELTLPKGVEADPEMLNAFKTMAKETGISAENAQKIVDIYATAHQASQRKHTESWTAQQAEWVKAIQTDKDLGGANLKATQQTTQRAMKAFSTPDFSKFLDQSGLTNHPEMVRFLARVGQTLKEDNIAGTSTHSGSGKLTDEEVARRRYEKTWPTQ